MGVLTRVACLRQCAGRGDLTHACAGKNLRYSNYYKLFKHFLTLQVVQPRALATFSTRIRYRSVAPTTTACSSTLPAIHLERRLQLRS